MTRAALTLVALFIASPVLAQPAPASQQQQAPATPEQRLAGRIAVLSLENANVEAALDTAQRQIAALQRQVTEQEKKIGELNVRLTKGGDSCKDEK
jgi:hypothetical protein